MLYNVDSLADFIKLLYNYYGDTMDIGVLKEAIMEYCENIHALAINYLHKNNNPVLENYIHELTMLEDDIRICDNVDILDAYKKLLEVLVNKIEGIINE